MELVDSRGETPLLIACYMRNEEDVAALLIERGANVNPRAPRGFGPLHYAAGRGEEALVERLLAAGADVNAMTDDGDTPLDFAVRSGHATVAEVLRKLMGRNGRPARQ
jgi:ankyrin repeat protein